MQFLPGMRALALAVCAVAWFSSTAAADEVARPPALHPRASHKFVLARVEVAGDVRSYGLPVQALLQDAAGRDYLLVFGRETELRRARWPYRVLDPAAHPPEDYILAVTMRPANRPATAGNFNVVLDDGVRLIIRATASEAEALAEQGFELQRLAREPMAWPKTPRESPGTGGPHHDPPPPLARPEPFVEGMISQVRSNNLFWLLRRVTGEEAVYSGGEPYVLTTRHTASGLPVARALQFAWERLQPLNLDVRFHGWSAGGYTNRNLIATLPGTIRSNEFVLITAHFDDMPSGARAPGADDNASGSAAVLTAASVLSRYHFERSIRFALFTGEEQGLLGSGVYATAASTAGDNIVGVLNADMIAWNAVNGPNLRLFIRTNTNPSYSNDLALAIAFTNVVSDYGLAAELAPVVTANSMGQSDHVSFWNRGYAGMLVTEDYPSDFNAYYHTVNDNLAHMNLRYCTAATRALIGTVANLATPVELVPLDVLRVTAGNWGTNSGVGGGAFLAKILPAPAAPGLDASDVAWSDAPAPPLASWLKPYSELEGEPFQTDARPDADEVRFVARLGVVSTNGSALSTSNRLQFDFLAPPRADRIYLARVSTDPAFTQPAVPFLSVTNLRDLVVQGGQTMLPDLSGATNGAAYGTCELVVRRLNSDRSACQLRLDTAGASSVVLAATAQVGAPILDSVETSSILDGSGPWQTLASFTNNVAPDTANFDGGWMELSYVVDTSGLPPAPQRFFRIRRTWLPQ
jgi:hypothetical protein